MEHSQDRSLMQSHLQRKDLSRLDKLLLILSSCNEKKITAAAIKTIAFENGLRECLKWNISDILKKSNGKSILLQDKWCATELGINHLYNLQILEARNVSRKKDVADLRQHLESIKKPEAVSFIEEAIGCLEANQKKAAIVFSWAGAMAILHDYVLKNHLQEFNSEALKRFPKWKVAKNSDDLGRMKEYDFLDIIEYVSMIGKNVKEELQTCLKKRNACGHPSSLVVGERVVAAHLETLILNVYSKF